MNATMSRNLIRFIAAPVAAAGIMGGAAWASAPANASTTRTLHRRAYTGMRRNARHLATCRSLLRRMTRRWTPSAGVSFFGHGYNGGLCSITMEPLTLRELTRSVPQQRRLGSGSASAVCCNVIGDERQRDLANRPRGRSCRRGRCGFSMDVSKPVVASALSARGPEPLSWLTGSVNGVAGASFSLDRCGSGPSRVCPAPVLQPN